MEASCNNPAVYQAGRWQQLVSIQPRTLPILLSPPRCVRTASLLSVFFSSFCPLSTISTSFFILRFFLSFSFPCHLSSSPLPYRDLSLSWFTPVHLLIRFKSGPLAPTLSGCLARFTEQSGIGLTLLSWDRLSGIALEIFVSRTH